MKYIKLTNENKVLIDDIDFDFINQYKWRLGSRGYAIRSNGKKVIMMHRLINGTSKGLETDHINRNKLDNRRSNLRSVTSSQNHMNKGIPKNNKTGFKGIYWSEKRNKWTCYIRINRKTINLGMFLTKIEAIEKRKEAEKKYFGEFGNLGGQYACC